MFVCFSDEILSQILFCLHGILITGCLYFVVYRIYDQMSQSTQKTAKSVRTRIRFGFLACFGLQLISIILVTCDIRCDFFPPLQNIQHYGFESEFPISNVQETNV